jgi:hypothetical protein
MPRFSSRRSRVKELEGELETHLFLANNWENMFGTPQDPLLATGALFVMSMLHKAKTVRYQHRGRYRKRLYKRFKEILYGEADDPNDISSSRREKEFLKHYRIDEENFWKLHNEIKDHWVFGKPGSSKTPQAPSEYQLLVLLKYIGTQGSDAANESLTTHFRIGSGTCEIFRRRVCHALIDVLEPTSYLWPDAKARQAMSTVMQQQYLFPNCIGLMDGTLLPLEFKPMLDGECYFSRKGFYALNMLIVCDYLSKVTYYQVGWPGSVHDNRVWRTCKLGRKTGEYFLPHEYLLTDSAFTASDHIVPAFKATKGVPITSNNSNFNTLLAQPRIKSEHCIGLLKGRFPWLKNIRIRIKEKKDLRRIVEYVRVCVILHNAFVEAPYEKDWIDERFDDLEDGDELNKEISLEKPGDERRNQLVGFFSELDGTGIN